MRRNKTQVKRIAGAVMALMLLIAVYTPAYGVLDRVGPVSNAPSVGGYPAWYQDTTGLALEFCDPKNALERDQGWCLLLGPDAPVVPEVFPGQFADEHFWFGANAQVDAVNGGKGTLVLGLEAAFTANVAPGQQIAFSRIRVRLDSAPVTGNYRFIHPYGEEVLSAVQGERIFFTDDVGINCAPGDFECATNSRLGPFLVPSLAPGGAELPPVTGPVPGKRYLATPDRLGPVTGSALPDFLDSTGALRNHNLFRIEGPAGSNLGGQGVDFVETSDFNLVGRLFEGVMPGRVDLDRATYARDASGVKLDVFAVGSPTVQGRIPGQARPAAVLPFLSYFDGPCAGTVITTTGEILPPYGAPVGVTEHQMASAGSLYWGQSQPAALPSSVCVKDASARDINGNTVPVFYMKPTTDDVTISEAMYDPTTRSLSVKAVSSDEVVTPTLKLAFDGFLADLVSGQIDAPSIAVPPSIVKVLSSAGGSDDRRVVTGVSAAPPAGAPVAANDSALILEDSLSQIVNILANDTNVTGGAVNLTSLPRLGSATVNPDGTLTYRPNPNANGLDSFTYAVTVGAVTSNQASVSITITPVNDAPVALNDTYSALSNQLIPLSVLSNDTDLDGNADLVGVSNLTQPTPAGAVATVVGNVVNFTASLPGLYTFTYQARDASGALSSAATVNVTVSAAETIVITQAEYRRLEGRLRLSGTVTPVSSPPQVLEIRWANGTNTTTLVTTVIPSAAGAWAIDLRLVTGILNPTNSGATQVVVTGPGGARTVANISFR